MYSGWNNFAPDLSKTSFAFSSIRSFSAPSPDLFANPNFWCSSYRTDWLNRRNPEIIHLHKERPSQILAEQARILEQEFRIELTEYHEETPDGFRLRRMHMAPPGAWLGDKYVSGDNRGDFYIFVEGKSDSCEAMVPTMAEVVFAGNQAATWDLRYQGRSSRLEENPQKVHSVGDFCMEHGGDLQQFYYQHIKPRLPNFGRVYIVGYSTGAAVSFMSLVRNVLPQKEIERFYPVSPLIRSADLDTIQGKFLVAGIWLSSWGSLNKNYCYQTGDRNWASEIDDHHDVYTQHREQLEEIHEFCRRDPWLLSGGPTWGWILAAARYFAWQRTVPENALSVPTTAILAGGDKVVVNRAAMEVLGRVATEFGSILLPKESHALEISCPRAITNVADIVLDQQPRMPYEQTVVPFPKRSPAVSLKRRLLAERERVSLQAA